jgi:hypothetical protein
MLTLSLDISSYKAIDNCRYPTGNSEVKTMVIHGATNKI